MPKRSLVRRCRRETDVQSKKPDRQSHSLDLLHAFSTSAAHLGGFVVRRSEALSTAAVRSARQGETPPKVLLRLPGLRSRRVVGFFFTSRKGTNSSSSVQSGGEDINGREWN